MAKKPNFKVTIANIYTKIRTMTCIDKSDAEFIEKILQEAIDEYYTVLEGYYEEASFDTIDNALSKAYDAGHSDGYDDGYENGYADCHAKNSY